jgi:hypothetical protein
LLKI